MIHILDRKATDPEVAEMLEALESYIKLAIDVDRGVLAGGGTLHADCEATLLENEAARKVFGERIGCLILKRLLLNR